MQETEASMSAHLTRRRDALRLLLGSGLGVAATPLLPSGVALGATDYTTRATYDEFLDSFKADPTRLGQATDPNDNQGALAWGQSYVLTSLLLAYLAFRDDVYLDTFVDHADAVLDSRDGERGVRDYRGLSLPAWRAGFPYTAGAVDLPDHTGRPCLQVRSVRTPIEVVARAKPLVVDPLITVDVGAGTADGSFRLTVTHAGIDVTESYDNLTMDPTASSYAVRVLHDAWPTELQLTAKDLRARPAAGPVPRAGSRTMASQPAVFAVHTGMITYPLADFARTVLERSSLRARYGSEARRFVRACEAAVAVHDREWRENDRGEGWYASPRGMPVPYADGTEQPANQFLALGRTAQQLAAVSRDPVHARRARAMARTFRNELTVDAGGAYIWHYWLTWGRVYNGWTKADDVSEYRPSYSGARQIEDVSHGFIDVDFAVRAFRDRRGFGRTDMDRFARTFTQNVATEADDGTPTVWSNVDGTGTRGTFAFELISAGWMPLATFDRAIFDHVHTVFRQRGVNPTNARHGSNVFDVANLAWFANHG
jgi:hypothetical protein